MKNTPGPWTIRESYTGSGKLVVFGRHDIRVAMISDKDDAALIAAAPQLLSALKSLNGWIKAEVEMFGGSDPDDDIQEAVEAAIKAAEG